LSHPQQIRSGLLGLIGNFFVIVHLPVDVIG
jgi:hypothetical protein